MILAALRAILDGVNQPQGATALGLVVRDSTGAIDVDLTEMKIVAIVGLLLCAYFGWRVFVARRYESSTTEKILWFVTIVCGGGYFLSLLLG